jgi:hypothetical protein
MRYCFLDEKWFYTKTYQSKIKFLPPSIHEEPEEAHCYAPKVRSRRFPCKVMFMRIIAPPIKEQNFDGKILLK